MSLFSSIQADAAEAQEFIAQMGGKTPTGTNALYNGAAITVAFGDARVMEIPVPNGAGYRRRVEVQASAIRSQFEADPVSRIKIVRTDLSPNQVYVISDVLTHDPIRYHFTLVKVGGE